MSDLTDATASGEKQQRRLAPSQGLARTARILALGFLLGAALATWVLFTFGGG